MPRCLRLVPNTPILYRRPTTLQRRSAGVASAVHEHAVEPRFRLAKCSKLAFPFDIPHHKSPPLSGRERAALFHDAAMRAADGRQIFGYGFAPTIAESAITPMSADTEAD